MNTTTHILLVLLAGVAGIGATPPASPQPAQTGKVLLLDSEQILEGTIEKVGNNYRIKGQTGEITLPVNRTIALVQTRKEALDVLRQYADQRDPDEHLRLARWCILQGLRDEAIVEVQAVLRIDSKNADAEIILFGLRQNKPVAQASPRPKVQAVANPPIIEVTPADFNRESFGLFVTKVQPILMNTCISCHGNGKGGSFQLIRMNMPGDRKANLHNLAMSLKLLDRKHPAKSPLLVNSITAHGGMEIAPPLRDQKILAYQNLEAWVSLALAEDGSADGISMIEAEKAPERKWEPKQSSTAAKKTGPVFGEESTSKPLPEIKSAPSDPFDPAIFNGEIKNQKR